MYARWIALSLVLAAGCSTMTLRIPRTELQADMATRFPAEVDKRVIVLRASAPQIEFPGAPDVMAVRLRVDATSASGNSQLGGSARVEGRIEYVETEHAFYLRDPEVTDLELDPPQGDGSLARAAGDAHLVVGFELVERAMRAAIEELLRHEPVYRLDARREKDAKAMRHLRRVRIVGQDLVAEVSL